MLRYVNGVMSHGNFSYPRNTQRTWKKILVEDYSKDFVLDLPIGYFCHDSAKNKFLDLFSALAAPKIRACKAIPKKPLLQSNVLLRIFSRDFYFEIIVG